MDYNTEIAALDERTKSNIDRMIAVQKEFAAKRAEFNARAKGERPADNPDRLSKAIAALEAKRAALLEAKGD